MNVCIKINYSIITPIRKQFSYSRVENDTNLEDNYLDRPSENPAKNTTD